MAFWIDFKDGSGFHTRARRPSTCSTSRRSRMRTCSTRSFPEDRSLEVPRAMRGRSANRAAARDPVVGSASASGKSELRAGLGKPAKSAAFSSSPGRSKGTSRSSRPWANLWCPDINPVTGLATGDGQIGAFSVVGTAHSAARSRITGRIGNPPNSSRRPGRRHGPFKYRDRGVRSATVQHLDSRWTNPIVGRSRLLEWFNGNPF